MQQIRRALLLAVLLIGLGRSAVPARSAPTAPLAQALSSLPISAGSVAFTDWALIKRYTGTTGLTSASPQAQRLRLMQSLNHDQAAFSAYGLSHFVDHAATWSWDSADLLWEANGQVAGGPPAYVLRFRDTFSFAPLIALFAKRGFTVSSYHGVPIYAHAMDVSAPWLTTTEFAILHTAVLTARHTLVLSSALPSVQALLDAIRGASPSVGHDPQVEAASARLGVAASAMVFSGKAACALFSPGSGPLRSMPAALKKRIVDQFGLARIHPYAALAVGYRYEGTQPIVSIVMHYADAAMARADLPIRKNGLAAGNSAVAGQPYRTLLVLDSASVQGSDLVLLTHPARGGPRIVVDMVFAADMLFAGCPAG